MDYTRVANLAAMFFQVADASGEKPFMWAKREGVFKPWSYGEVARDVARLAKGLQACGVAKGDRVVIVSENRPEWVIADLAIVAAGAITTPAYTTNTADDHRYILNHSEAKAVIIADRKLAETVIPAAREAESCALLIAMPGLESEAGVEEGASTDAALRSLGWQEVLAMGDAVPGDGREIAASLARDEVCCFIYTSGTGGRPKGVMLSHGAILANCYSAYDLLLEQGLGAEVFLSLLPLSHAYEHTVGLYLPISIAAEVYYSEGPDKIAQNLQEVRPTIMTAVPRLYEVLHDRIRRGVDQAGGLSARLFHKAVALGRKHYETPHMMSLGDRLLDRILTVLVRRKVGRRFGGRLKCFVSGGAALNPDIGHFFLALGVRILQGYGQTEAAPVISCNRPGRIRIDTVGPALAGVEVRIAADGEILARGELLMKGYWRDAEATAATIVDGWLHTGDIGEMEADGYIRITDRKKDIIVNSGGDNIAPARVESALTLAPEFDQAMVYGDKRPYLVAVIVPSETFIADWVRSHGGAHGGGMDFNACVGDEDFRRALDAALTRVNESLSRIEKVRRMIVADAPFTTDNAQLTPTLKVRRNQVLEVYSERLSALYPQT